MNLDIITPEKEVFSGEVESVTLPGSKGMFQVLNNHAALVSSLDEGDIKYRVSGESQDQKIRIESGFVEVLNNKVTVLVEGTTGQ